MHRALHQLIAPLPALTKSNLSVSAAAAAQPPSTPITNDWSISLVVSISRRPLHKGKHRQQFFSLCPHLLLKLVVSPHLTQLPKMAGSAESLLQSSETKLEVVVTNEGGDSVPEKPSSLTEEQKDEKSRTSTTPASTEGFLNKHRSCSDNKSKRSKGKRPLPVPRRSAAISSSSSDSFAEQTSALFADPPLCSSPGSSGSSGSSPPSATTAANGPTFAQIATRPIRTAKMIMSKVTVELTGQEFYLVQDDQSQPFLLDKDIIESKYSHLLPIYRASIRGKRDSWIRGKFI